MKTINTYINEKLKLTSKQKYTCHPKNKTKLRQIILKRIKEEGPTCDLNDIDVSQITNMESLFDVDTNEIFKDFNGDISMWNVSNVTNMDYMFYWCTKFNCDLSKWNVSKVEYMFAMFDKCEKFNQDLDSRDVSNVENMCYAFYACTTQPTWYDADK